MDTTRPVLPVPADLVIAIDGPSGTGKSSVARRTAGALGLRYLDTGAMYRAVTVAALAAGADLRDAAAVEDLARHTEITVSTDPEHSSVLVDGRNVTAEIRTERISTRVSAVASNLGVRAVLVAAQQAIVGRGGIVLEGRDTTTVVAPHAAVRILLTAAEDVRLARRARETHGHAGAAAVAATHDSVVRRDAADSAVTEFRSAAHGVVEIDTSHLDLDESVSAVLGLVEHLATATTSRTADTAAAAGRS